MPAPRAGTLEIAPMQVPLTLFVWSKNRIVPVRLTDISAVEDAFDADLNPIRAKVSLGFRVLTVDDLGFTPKGGSLYMVYQQQKEALAALYRTRRPWRTRPRRHSMSDANEQLRALLGLPGTATGAFARRAATTVWRWLRGRCPMDARWCSCAGVSCRKPIASPRCRSMWSSRASVSI